MSQDANIDAYFERISFSGSIAPSLATLEQLHQLHPSVIPFENLNPLLNMPVRLELKNLEQKLVFEKRGGYCFEQNLLFRAVLEELGFEVTSHGARVLWDHDEDEGERPVSHLVLLVDIGGASYLADVGFGGLTLTAPLRLRADVEQATPHETYRLTGGDAEWRLEADVSGEWKPLYSFTPEELTIEQISTMNDAASAGNRFSQNLIAARSGRERRRHTLHNIRLRTHATDGEAETRRLRTVTEMKEVLANTFGINLPTGERLDAALDAVLTRELQAIPAEER